MSDYLTDDVLMIGGTILVTGPQKFRTAGIAFIATAILQKPLTNLILYMIR